MARRRGATLSGTFELKIPLDIGQGAPIVVLHGFAMRPATYRATAELLAGRGARVVVPDLFDVPAPWRFDDVVKALELGLERRGLDRVTLVGHSFGGGIELGYAVTHLECVEELVFSDTLAVSEQWGLADEALRHPLGILRLATPEAIRGFVSSLAHYPRQLAAAGWWGFRSERQTGIERVAQARIPAHVLWASRDSILAQSDGRQFAEQLHADFTVAQLPDGGPVDHDWMFQNPELFVRHLDELKLRALAPVR
ncbi:MAG: alpha/beta fold hydrolase [Acidimicrobiales bacterium]